MNSDALSQIAAKQYGVFSRSQAFQCGYSQRGIQRRVQKQQWLQLLPGVYRFPTASVHEIWKQRAMAAVIWGRGGALSHTTAGAIVGLPRMDDAVIHLTVPGKTRSPAPWLQVHDAELPSCDRAREGHFVITSVPRILIDLATIFDAERLEATLDSALMLGRTSIKHVKWRLENVPVQRRRGIDTLRRLVAERGPEVEETQSELELFVQREFRKAGLEMPVPQVTIRHEGRHIRRVDFAYPDLKIAIEAESWKHHGSKSDREKDIRWHNELMALGWVVILVTHTQIRDEPQVVIEQIRRAIAQRTRRAAGSGE